MVGTTGVCFSTVIRNPWIQSSNLNTYTVLLDFSRISAAAATALVMSVILLYPVRCYFRPWRQIFKKFPRPNENNGPESTFGLCMKKQFPITLRLCQVRETMSIKLLNLKYVTGVNRIAI